jgi:hypothetical protein
MQAVVRSKSKDWLTCNQYNVDWGGATCLPMVCCFRKLGLSKPKQMCWSSTKQISLSSHLGGILKFKLVAIQIDRVQKTFLKILVSSIIVKILNLKSLVSPN